VDSLKGPLPATSLHSTATPLTLRVHLLVEQRETGEPRFQSGDTHAGRCGCDSEPPAAAPLARLGGVGPARPLPPGHGRCALQLDDRDMGVSLLRLRPGDPHAQLFREAARSPRLRSVAASPSRCGSPRLRSR
jgi:hypothetical protein